MNGREKDGRQDGAIFLGQEVRFAREHRGLTQQQLAEEAQYERPYVSRVEGGSLLASTQFAEACDRVFDTAGFFVRLRERVAERGHPGWFVPYVKLEQAATGISDYSNSFIMGMLQTSAYAEAIFRATHPREDDEQIKARVKARLRRREVMERKRAPLLWVILHEAVLRTVVGSPAVMVEQLEHLCTVAATPDITLQVLPFTAGAPAASLPFILLTSEDGTQILYTEARGSGHVDDSAVEVEDARATYERLRAAAASPEESLSLIRSTMEEHAR